MNLELLVNSLHVEGDGVNRDAKLRGDGFEVMAFDQKLKDALLVRGVPVRHILSLGEAKPHELSEFARETGGGIIYPGLL